MIHFIFGQPGTGKTHLVVERIREMITSSSDDRRPVYLIVPEQQVYSSERDVLSALPPEAGRRFSIVSFSRLSDLVSSKYGGRSFTSLSRSARSLLMWRNLRELKGLLEEYTASDTDDTSLCRLMLQLSVEMKCSAIEPSQLENAAKRLDPSGPLYRKLRDIALVTSAYDGLLREVCGENPADRLVRTAGQITAHRFFDGATVFIDSFTSFTMQEYALLRPLFAQAEDVTVTVCADRRDMQNSPFDSLKDTVRRLTRLCEETGTDYDDTVLHTVYRTSSAELQTLADELWSFGLTPDARVIPSTEQRGNVRLITAPNVYEEVQAAMLHIRELVGRGIPYGRIAVVVRDTTAWRGVLDAAFEQYRIPYFLSERKGLSDLPAARLLLCALRCIRRGYQTEDVITLCKTGLCGVTLSDLDAFQEYVETWRIRGHRMTGGAWSMNPDGYKTALSTRGKRILDAANRVREAVITPLVALETALALAPDPTAQCAALYDFLCALSVKKQLSARAEALLALGKTQEAGETVRLWSFLCETLASIATILPEDEQPLPTDELSAALSLVFEETDIGSVPARHECVTVGSADTLRVDNVSAMLLLGLCEGEFPQTVSDSGLLSEQDKATLSDMGIEFHSRTDRRSSEELLYVWRAVTKPSDDLLLFTHTATPDGSAKSPSVVFTRVNFLLPYLQPITFSEALLGLSGDQLRYVTPIHDRLSRSLTHAMLGDTINLSQSRIQAYARCPYSYYGTHILRLRAREEARIGNASAGTFLHKVLELYLRAALGADKRIRVLSDEEVTALAEQIMTDCIRELCGDISGDGRLLHLFDRLRAIALVLIRSIQTELEQGSFCVAGLEWDTHGRQPTDPRPLRLDIEVETEDTGAVSPLSLPADLPAIVAPDGPLPLPGQRVRIIMGGIIDRVDVFRDGKTVYVRVIDYKSSKHIFTEKSVVGEMNIQLLLYLFTLCSPENRALFADENGELPDTVLPAEALYISPTESTRDGSIAPTRSGIIMNHEVVLTAASPERDLTYLPGVTRNKAGELSGASLVSFEHMQTLQTVVETVIKEAATALYSGQADRIPDGKSCRYCVFFTSCPLAEKSAF